VGPSSLFCLHRPPPRHLRASSISRYPLCQTYLMCRINCQVTTTIRAQQVAVPSFSVGGYFVCLEAAFRCAALCRYISTMLELRDQFKRCSERGQMLNELNKTLCRNLYKIWYKKCTWRNLQSQGRDQFVCNGFVGPNVTRNARKFDSAHVFQLLDLHNLDV
jgi:hypothetical protein